MPTHTPHRAALILLPLLLLAACASPLKPVNNPAPSESDATAQLAHHFEGRAGAIVIIDLTNRQTTRVNPIECARRHSPCSTFKVPHALIALQTGVVTDPDEILFPYDDEPHPYDSWEADQSLRTALRDSVVWWFQRLAPTIGRFKMTRNLARIPYGNMDLSSSINSFWLHPGSLQISADEQADILTRLYTNTLPFSPDNMATIRDLIVLETSPTHTLSGKTGTGIHPTFGTRVLSWFIGHVQTPDAEIVFACNIHSKTPLEGQPARAAAIAILRDLGHLPD